MRISMTASPGRAAVHLLAAPEDAGALRRKTLRVGAPSRLFCWAALATALLAACSPEEKNGKGTAPLVEAVEPARRAFVDHIETVGTAHANEQVTLASPVTERLERLLFEDGDYLRAGQVVAVLATGPEDASLSGAVAQERLAEQQLARLSALKARGFATNASLDVQAAAASSARAAAAQARAEIADRVLRAPFSGYVSLRNISAGAIVNQGSPIVTISDISRIKLDFAVPETIMLLIKPGQAIDVRSPALPDRAFKGRIATVDPVIDPDTRAVKVRAILPNPGGLLKPGMLLNVSIAGRERYGRAVPELAVLGEGDQRYVFAVGANRRARRVAVRTGARDQGLIEIVGDLRPGEKVVAEGVVKVSDGKEVRLRGATGPSPKAAGRP